MWRIIILALMLAGCSIFTAGEYCVVELEMETDGACEFDKFNLDIEWRKDEHQTEVDNPIP